MILPTLLRSIDSSMASKQGAYFLKHTTYKISLISSILATIAVFVFRANSMAKEYLFSLHNAASYGIFQSCRDGPWVYHDFKQESVAHIFNVLFYAIYGMASRLLGDCVNATPAVGRFVTVGILLLVGTFFVLVLRARRVLLEQIVLASLCISPFVGWWAFAMRPDAGAGALIGASACAMWLYLEKQWYGYILLCYIFGVAGWGFKQPALAFALPIFAAPILLRKGGRLPIIGAFGVTIGLTVWYAIAGKSYYQHTLQLVGQHPWALGIAIMNFKLFIGKAAGIICCIAILLWARITDRNGCSWSAGEKALVGVGAIALVGSAVTAAKIGAYEYYYFPFFFISVVYAMCVLPRVQICASRTAMASLSAINILLSVMVLFGVRGTTHLASTSETARLVSFVVDTPLPRFVLDETAAQPWVIPNVEQRAFDPWIDIELAQRLPGRIPLEELIAKGHFATLVLPAGKHNFDTSHYSLKGVYGNLEVLVHR